MSENHDARRREQPASPASLTVLPRPICVSAVWRQQCGVSSEVSLEGDRAFEGTSCTEPMCRRHLQMQTLWPPCRMEGTPGWQPPPGTSCTPCLQKWQATALSRSRLQRLTSGAPLCRPPGTSTCVSAPVLHCLADDALLGGIWHTCPQIIIAAPNQHYVRRVRSVQALAQRG